MYNIAATSRKTAITEEDEEERKEEIGAKQLAPSERPYICYDQSQLSQQDPLGDSLLAEL